MYDMFGMPPPLSFIFSLFKTAKKWKMGKRKIASFYSMKLYKRVRKSHTLIRHKVVIMSRCGQYPSVCMDAVCIGTCSTAGLYSAFLKVAVSPPSLSEERLISRPLDFLRGSRRVRNTESRVFHNAWLRTSVVEPGTGAAPGGAWLAT